MTNPATRAPSGEHAPAQAIELLLDGRAHRVATGTTLAELIASLGHRPEAVGSAVDGNFVARSARAHWVLEPGQSVLLFQPIVGG